MPEHHLFHSNRESTESETETPKSRELHSKEREDEPKINGSAGEYHHKKKNTREEVYPHVLPMKVNGRDEVKSLQQTDKLEDTDFISASVVLVKELWCSRRRYTRQILIIHNFSYSNSSEKK